MLCLVIVNETKVSLLLVQEHIHVHWTQFECKVFTAGTVLRGQHT